MTSKFSRRDFLKFAGASAAVTTILTGCGPVARHVVRRPYYEMPEFNKTGGSTYYATTCRECAAGCGIIMRTFEGRAIKAEGNPNHPVNRGKICSRGLTAVQSLYNPDRITAPRKHLRGEENYEELNWDAAIDVVRQQLADAGSSAAFLIGSAPDHLFDLITELTESLGAPPPVRYSTLGSFAGRSTLIEAVNRVYGASRVPYFDIANSDLVLSFGANLLGEWLSPLSYARQFRQMRQSRFGRGRLISIEPRLSNTGGGADDWIPAAPGTEGMVALALGRMIAEEMGTTAPGIFEGVDINTLAETAGVSINQLRDLAARFASARQPVAIPGGTALIGSNGVEAAQAILALNALSSGNGRPGSVFFVPSEEDAVPSGGLGVQELIDRMNSGQVSTLFIHGVNPVFELPAALGFEAALAKVGTVISFSPFPDETTAQSDYLLPDHSSLESFGYQRMLDGADRTVFSAMQPVVAPLYNTQATVDVLLAAASAAGAGLRYNDEVEFIQSRVRSLLDQAGGNFGAGELPTFWAQFLQTGGWWARDPQLEPAGDAAVDALEIAAPQQRANEQELHLVVYANHFGDGSVANRPWIQETPDPLTTVTWNSWILIHPETAHDLGINDNEVVTIRSGQGEVEAVTYFYPAIRPDTVAMPFGQGHTAMGRWADGRGANPALLLTGALNPAGELALADTRVTVTATGRRRPLATVENKEGVYGEGEEITRD